MLHQVNKLQFEATCATEAQAFELRHNFSQTGQGQIAEVIDKVCSRYVSEDEWIQIDKIEVDLGNFNIHSFEKLFTGLFLAKFEKEFSNKVRSMPVAEKENSKQVSYLKMLFYFLQTGTLPWWASDETINMNAVFTEVVEQQQQPLYSFLQQHRFTAAIWQRIAMQFNPGVHKLIVSFFPKLTAAEKKLMKWASFFEAENDNRVDEINLIRPLEKQMHKFVLQHAPVFFSTVKEDRVMQQLINQFADEFIRLASAPVSAEEIVQKIIAYEKTATDQQAFDFVAKEESEREEEAVPVIATEATRAEKFTVHTAGTVLLAPYFKQLFTHLNLLEHGEWKNREAHYKAIHLTRYMATGQLMCPEHSLVMEKLLCGMDITAAIPREVLLSDEEKAEANALLKAVITNWVKLKNTSVDGLRETFLKRDGILSKKENGWLLQVERKTADVLLESIPWGYTTIALPWNSYIIFTEW